MQYKNSRRVCVIALSGLVAGCAGSPFQPWNDPLYERIIEPHAESADAASVLSTLSTTEDSSARKTALAAEHTLTLDGAIRYAVFNHPELRRSAFGVQAAAGREIQARLYPNPAIAIDTESLGSNAGRGGETTYLLQQEFVTAGKRKKAGAVAQTDRLIAQERFRQAEFDVATRVAVSFFAAVASEQRLQSQNELLELASDLLSAAEARVEAGAVTEPDRLRAEVVYEQATIDVQTARSDAAATRRALAAAMGIDGALDVELVSNLTDVPDLPSEEVMLVQVLEHNTRVEQARLGIERATRAYTLARAQAIPNFTASLGPRYSDPANETTVDVGLGIAIPIFNRNQGEIAATMAERIAAGAALGSVRLDLIDAVVRARAAYASARYAAERYQTSLLPKSQRTLDLTRQAYRAGKTDYLRLLDAQQTYVRSRIASVDALESLHQAAALLEGLMQNNTPWRDAPGERETTP